MKCFSKKVVFLNESLMLVLYCLSKVKDVLFVGWEKLNRYF